MSIHQVHQNQVAPATRRIDDLLRVISVIYSVPGSAENWPVALAQLGQLVGAEGIAYLLFNYETLQPELNHQFGYPDEVTKRYIEIGASQDIRVKHIDNLVPGKVFREFEYVPDRAAYDANEWIQYQLKSLGLYWCMSAHISTHRLWADYISVNRLQSRGPHTDEEKACLQALLPHLARAGELHRTVSGLQNRYGAVLSVLDRLLVGLVILDENGRVVVANSTARASCDASGALRLEGRLRAVQVPKDDQLQGLIQRTGMTAIARDQSDGGQIVVEKRDRSGSLLLEVMPLRDDGLPDRDNIKGTAVFIIDSAAPFKISSAALAKIFLLTPTEEAIADSLLNGAGLRQIAEERGNSVETVRSHLKSIFSKTGSSSQLELLRLSVKASPPIEGVGNASR
jgi:DNA-binding CsgD family transcriptional regulator